MRPASISARSSRLPCSRSLRRRSSAERRAPRGRERRSRAAGTAKVPQAGVDAVDKRVCQFSTARTTPTPGGRQGRAGTAKRNARRRPWPRKVPVRRDGWLAGSLAGWLSERRRCGAWTVPGSAGGGSALSCPSPPPGAAALVEEDEEEEEGEGSAGRPLPWFGVSQRDNRGRRGSCATGRTSSVAHGPCRRRPCSPVASRGCRENRRARGNRGER